MYDWLITTAGKNATFPGNMVQNFPSVSLYDKISHHFFKYFFILLTKISREWDSQIPNFFQACWWHSSIWCFRRCSWLFCHLIAVPMIWKMYFFSCHSMPPFWLCYHPCHLMTPWYNSIGERCMFSNYLTKYFEKKKCLSIIKLFNSNNTFSRHIIIMHFPGYFYVQSTMIIKSHYT